MTHIRRSMRLATAALLTLLAACGGRMPGDVGGEDLAPCPATPNCVSSLEPAGSSHHVAPLSLAVPPGEAWPVVVEVMRGWPRTEIASAGATRLHAVARSALFRFADDVELRLDADAGRIDVRSASRVGRSDLGVNRRRVEKLRAELGARGVVAPGEGDGSVREDGR